MSAPLRPELFSLGHGARALEAFLDLLRGAEITRLVDVRTAPGSRKHPHFGKDELWRSLAGVGIEYSWERDLGGWRRPNAGSPHVALRAEGFRGYADHMESPEFQEGLGRLIQSGVEGPTAFMCSESLWWRCHRRLISDALVARGYHVHHLMEGGRLERHGQSPSARVQGDRLVYDVEKGQQQLMA